jgi:hypothetical protein
MLRAKPNRWKFDPDEPRDESGRWTDGGGSGESGSDKPAPADKPAETLDPKVVEVGGDEWNKATARRLEKEYQQVKPKLAEIVDKAVGKDIEEPREDDEEEPDDEPYIPESWDELSSDVQSQAGDEYVKNETDSYYDSEKEHWYSSGGALDEAKGYLADGHSRDWLKDELEEYRDQRDEDGKADIPYSDATLLKAISLSYDSNGEGNGDLTIDFDDSELQEPTNLPPPEQGTLPGIEPAKPEAQLTEEMRDDLTKLIEKAFDKKADAISGEMDPPDYLQDNAKEFAGENWDHGLSDKQKFEWIKDNTDLIEQPTESNTSPDSASAGYWHIDALPKRYDPLNDTSGEDYKRTQALARYLSIERAKQVLLDRGLVTDGANLRQNIISADNELWSGWKASSTSIEGKMIQLATADELNGRLRVAQIGDRAEIEKYANDNYRYQKIGGYAGVKAYIRAKWETTQYLLDKANKPDLTLYRGIKLTPEELLKLFEAIKQHVEDRSGYKALPKIHIERNGAASTTTDPSVANNWSADVGRVVLRGQMPRTAIISVPAYGINVHSEKEVVVTGTAWKGWDAWSFKAPPPEQVPMLHAA